MEVDAQTRADILRTARTLARDPDADARSLKGSVKGLLNLIEELEREGPGWAPKERAAIDALMKQKDLTEHAVLRMGIKWYQIISLMGEEGFEVVRFQTRAGELRPIGVPPGCGGED